MLPRRQRTFLWTAALAAVLGGAATVVPAAATDRVVVVRHGDTLSQIAVTQGVSVAELMRLNGIVNPNRIQVGQRILVAPPSDPAPLTPSAPAPVVHRVAPGENLTVIAQRYGTTIGAIVRANGISNPSFLRVGQRLTIPGASASAGTGAAMHSSMAALVVARDPIRRIIVAEATAQGVPVAFALAVAWQESGWQPAVASHAGAVGVMQLTPATADWVASTMLGGSVNLADPTSNVRAGVRLLRHYFDRYGGDRTMVLAAYYQGQTGADRHGIYPMTRPYIASILALEAIFDR
ncbi:MAG: LysM peptidoglycan-binding domain-containing protein [Chloroflexota bacterium]|nr:LysM peptidoglycan-binding domain-containing protein [Chloroflexota bacterium]